MRVKLIVEGGKMAPGPAVAQQLGPMGINLGKVISDVNEATKSFTGTKVPVELDVNPKTKSYEIQVFSPPVAELIKKQLKIEKGSGEALKTKVGNISIEELIAIAKTKSPDLLSKNTKSALRMIVGTCVSLGVMIDSKEAKEVEREIEKGSYDTIIKEERTTPTPEKKKRLESDFSQILAKQAAQKKAEEEAAAAAEAAKEAAAAEGTAKVKEAAPSEGEAKEPVSEGKKPEEKK